MLSVELRDYLRDHLPAYMVPPSIVIIDEMPLTPNKKVDTSALPEPDATADDEPATLSSPGDPVEREVIRIWTSVLNVGEVGSRDNFFRLGGHSIQMMRVIAALRNEFGVALTARSFLERPTVAALAAQIRLGRDAG